MQHANTKRLPAFLCAIAGATLLAGCGGGGGASSTATGLTGGWVTVLTPSDSGTYSSNCNDITLGGKAFISQTWYRCCSGDASDTGVTVSWKNLVTGSSGTAHQTPHYCLLIGTTYLCDHSWDATIALTLGDNIFEVTAIDPGGAGGTDTITVSKTENSWTVSGTLTSYEGTGLDIYRSGVGVNLKDESGSLLIGTSGAGVSGQFTLSCITTGNYLLEPTAAPFDHSFAPPWYAISVADSDVTGYDFKSVAYSASGSISYATNGDPVTGIQVEITDGSATFSRFLLQDGSYNYVVPAGSYTITPVPFGGYTFTPQSRSVDLSAGSQSDLDFIYNTQ